MSHHGVGLRAVMRSVAFLTAGVLAVPLLTACGGDRTKRANRSPGQDIAPAGRARLADGGTLRWAVDSVPETLNTFQADADATTTRVAQAVLPSMYRLDANGRAEPNADYLESAKVVDTEPKQVVLYKLQPAGRVERRPGDRRRRLRRPVARPVRQGLRVLDRPQRRIRPHREDAARRERPRGQGHLRRPYADWRSLFSPAVPQGGHGHPGLLQRRGAAQAQGHRRALQPQEGRQGGRRRRPRTQPALVGRTPPGWTRSCCTPYRATSAPRRSPPGGGRRRDRAPPRPNASLSPARQARPPAPGRPAPGASSATRPPDTPRNSSRPARSRCASRWNPPTPSSP